MLRSRILLWLTLAFPLLAQIPSAPRGGLPGTSAAGGVLRQLAIADFGGSGQKSVQFVAADPLGNIYAAGTTTSPDLPEKNAAQPNFAEARILRTTDLGATWARVGSPADVRLVTPDSADPRILFAGADSGIYKST